MRNALVLIALVVSLAACGGKKKSVANPSNSGAASETPDSKAAGSNDEKNMNSPADPNDPTTKSSDPCEGGE